jgi:GT2 family glycosyltransferase
MPTYKIAVGFISGNHSVHWGVVASLIGLMNAGTEEYEFTPIFVNSIYVDRNRTMVAAEFVAETDCDFLLLLDYDNGITKEGLDFFMEDFKDPDVNIVTGKYLYKGGKEGLMVLGYNPPDAVDGFHVSLPEEAFSKDLTNVSQELGRKAVVGCGCLMVRRRVFEEVPYPWFKTPWLEGRGPDDDPRFFWQGEDVYFSYHVQEHGFDIYFDQRIKSPHYRGSECYPPEWDQVNQ